MRQGLLWLCVSACAPVAQDDKPVLPHEAPVAPVASGELPVDTAAPSIPFAPVPATSPVFGCSYDEWVVDHSGTPFGFMAPPDLADTHWVFTPPTLPRDMWLEIVDVDLSETGGALVLVGGRSDNMNWFPPRRFYARQGVFAWDSIPLGTVDVDHAPHVFRTRRGMSSYWSSVTYVDVDGEPWMGWLEDGAIWHPAWAMASMARPSVSWSFRGYDIDGRALGADSVRNDLVLVDDHRVSVALDVQAGSARKPPTAVFHAGSLCGSLSTFLKQQVVSQHDDRIEVVLPIEHLNLERFCLPPHDSAINYNASDGLLVWRDAVVGREYTGPDAQARLLGSCGSIRDLHDLGAWPGHEQVLGVVQWDRLLLVDVTTASGEQLLEDYLLGSLHWEDPGLHAPHLVPLGDLDRDGADDFGLILAPLHGDSSFFVFLGARQGHRSVQSADFEMILAGWPQPYEIRSRDVDADGANELTFIYSEEAMVVSGERMRTVLGL